MSGFSWRLFEDRGDPSAAKGADGDSDRGLGTRSLNNTWLVTSTHAIPGSVALQIKGMRVRGCSPSDQVSWVTVC